MVQAPMLDAVRGIEDGATIGFGGLALPAIPGNLILALPESGARDLTLVANTTGGARDDPGIGMLVALGQVRKAICAFTAATRASQKLPFTEFYEAGKVEAELVPQGTLAERLRAAGAGIPAFFTPAAVDTELAEGRETRVFHGREYLLEEALPLDYAFVRAWQADTFGNLRSPAGAAELQPGDGDGRARHHRRGGGGGRSTRNLRPRRRPHLRRVRRPRGAYPADARGLVAATAERSNVMSGLTRQQMADRVARLFQDGWIVNLGVGMPTLCSNTDIGDTEIIYHAENGVIGYGPIAAPGHEDLHLVNAGGQFVTLLPGAAIVHHADSFALIRSGRIDVTVLGAYEAACNGDFANWKVAGAKGGGIGGAMDLSACARNVFLILEHATRTGAPRLVEVCAIPVTARGVVKRVMTNYGLFEPIGTAFRLLEIAPGIGVDEVRRATGADLVVPDDLREIVTGGPAPAP